MVFKRGDTVAQEKILYFIELISSFYTNSIECNVKISLYLLLCHFQAEQTINLLVCCSGVWSNTSLDLRLSWFNEQFELNSMMMLTIVSADVLDELLRRRCDHSDCHYQCECDCASATITITDFNICKMRVDHVPKQMLFRTNDLLFFTKANA